MRDFINQWTAAAMGSYEARKPLYASPNFDADVEYQIRKGAISACISLAQAMKDTSDLRLDSDEAWEIVADSVSARRKELLAGFVNLCRELELGSDGHPFVPKVDRDQRVIAHESRLALAS